MPWKVYVIKSQKNGIQDVGMSQDVARRLEEHNAGKSKFTSGHTPWDLVYEEEVETSIEARAREKYLKSAAGKRYLDKLQS